MYTLFFVYFFDYIRYEIKHIKKTQNCSISLSFFALLIQRQRSIGADTVFQIRKLLYVY